MSRRRKKKDSQVEGAFAAGAFILAYIIYSQTPLKDIVPAKYTLFLIGGIWIGLVVVTALIFFIVLRILRKPRQEPDPVFEFEAPVIDQAHQEFEHEVARLIEAMTGNRAVVVGGAGDHGVDIKVYQQNRLVGIVQCKQYAKTKTLPPSIIRDLCTVRSDHGVRTAYLVTTGKFSRDSREYAESHGVKLIDGEQLDKMRAKLREAAKSNTSLTSA